MSKSKKDEINWDKEIALAQIQVQTLERRLMSLARENADLERGIKEMEAEMRARTARVEREQADRYDMLQEMQRQFQQMQEELTRDIGEREKQIEVIRA